MFMSSFDKGITRDIGHHPHYSILRIIFIASPPKKIINLCRMKWIFPFIFLFISKSGSGGGGGGGGGGVVVCNVYQNIRAKKKKKPSTDIFKTVCFVVLINDVTRYVIFREIEIGDVNNNDDDFGITRTDV